MPLGDFIPEGTVQSRLLCEEISRRSDGICILAFSRGKDAIPAWIWLKQFFPTIIPYHSGPAPGLEYIDTSLEYYEQVFNAQIERFIDGEALENLSAKSFQILGNYELIDQSNLPKGYYDYVDYSEIVREKYNCPNAWHAMALLGADNIFRRMRLMKKDANGQLTYQAAILEDRKTFYPTFDWTIDQNIEAMKKNGIYLPDDYLMTRRTMNTIPSTENMEGLMELYPKDWKKIESLFPLLKSRWARNQFRKMKEPRNGVLKKTVQEIIDARELRQRRLAEREVIADKRKSPK